MAADDALWLTRRDAAKLIGISAAHFDNAIRPNLSPESFRGKSGHASLRVYAPAVVEYRIKQKVAEVAKPQDGDDAMLYAGSDSPNLERLREWKANHAELDFKKAKGELVARSEIEPIHVKLFGAIRRAVEIVQKRYGNDPAQIINEAVTDVQSQLKRMVEDSEPGRV